MRHPRCLRSPESMLLKCVPKLTPGGGRIHCRLPISLQQTNWGGNTLGTWDLKDRKPGKKMKRGGPPYSSRQGKKKDLFPSTSWQVGACLPPVWTSSPKRNSDSSSLSPSPAWAKVYLGEGHKRDSSLTAIEGHWASDVIKTLPSTRRRNKYYFMGKGRAHRSVKGEERAQSGCN